ncbi:MAG: DNA repair protein RadA [Bacteroides sp.]|nr:DNA repair protein RadA [Prevotella sp.]MCM1407120.1 DNA repair protein RadA [Treponema brennaborense]MCM1470272.1 DNA repair protein RadA [Bacteroides sp.]
MAKKRNSATVFKCSSCGYAQPKWLGRCPDCGEWNSFVEYAADASIQGNTAAAKAKPAPLSSVNPMEGSRLCTGISEFDRVLGGGAMKRSAILLGGEPGIGKSTLLLQAAASIAKSGAPAGRILYVSGEESSAQIRARADRLGLSPERIDILCTNRLDDIEDALNTLNPVFTVIDSIQTVFSAEAGIVPGTVNQLKYCANELITWVKGRDSVLIISAHVTKEGIIAGPKSLEHLVDTVISFDRNNDEIRFLRAQKNRFGSIDELGIFSMTESGLHPVEDPSTLFITRRNGKLPAGVAVAPVFEGSRVFLVEIQALTVPAKAAVTRVYSDKIDSARVSRVAAVIEKRAGLRFSDQDLYINVAGGVRLTESAIDAALAAALYSARADIPLPEGTVLAGELSLAGEIRPVNRMKSRAKTARNLGYTRILAPEQEPDITYTGDIKTMARCLFS